MTDGVRQDSAVDALLNELIARRENGEDPDPAELERRLASQDQRTELRGLVRALASVEAALPVRIAPGEVVAGRYRLERELGKGGMGRVFLAYDQPNSRTLAFKVMHTDFTPLAAGQLLKRERQALVRLRHPHIVTFLDADRCRDCFYLTMELVDGIGIAEAIERVGHERTATRRSKWWRDSSALARAIGRPVPAGRGDLLAGRNHFEATAAIIAACASALECAHAAGVVHRDLSARNVLLTGGGNPVLLDFGLAALQDATRGPLTSMLFGTPNYIAPEQAKNGRIGVDQRSDIYQLGIVLHEMLTLRRPWADEPKDQVVAAILARDLPPASAVEPAVPFELDRICARATERAPEERYPTATALRVDLERFLRKRVLPEAAVPGAPIRLRVRYLLHRPAVWIALAVVLVGLGILVLVVR